MNLRIPGPTPLPPEVRQALGRDMISHRGTQFSALLDEVTRQLRAFFQTEGDVLILTGSGTGGLEAALVNALSPGDRVLAVSCGAFGDRFASIACAFGGHVDRLDFPPGRALDAGAVGKALRSNPDTRILLTTHNETSTGVLNDLSAVARVLSSLGPDRPLWLVDAVSSLGAVDLPMDEWCCDVVVSASQKAWMAPPGLAFIGVSARAWEFVAQARCPRFYWDLTAARQYAAKGQTPFTPAVSALYALQASLRSMADEGLPAIVARHERMGAYLRNGLKELGLRLFADEAAASPTVTAVCAPAGTTASEMQQQLAARGVIVATGQGPLRDQILRIAHMGHCDIGELDHLLHALASLLQQERC
jgi:aspartate aminotransferase-like enzyme